MKKLSLLFLSLGLLLLNPAHAQTIQPPLASLSIELWPEYDQPATLVIYRATLSPEVTLPVDVTFRLPGYIEDMHAVALEQGNDLFSINPDLVEQLYEGDELLLSFPVTDRTVHLEYYDPTILTRAGPSRVLDYFYAFNHTVGQLSVQVQEPSGAANFTLEPAPTEQYVADDGLRYNIIEASNLVPGDTIRLQATYQRSTDTPTLQVSADDVFRPLDAAETEGSWQTVLGYILIGSGLWLLVGGGFYWWLRRRRHLEPAPVATNLAAFCHQCGTTLRPEAAFCHICGATRRQTQPD